MTDKNPDLVALCKAEVKRKGRMLTVKEYRAIREQWEYDRAQQDDTQDRRSETR